MNDAITIQADHIIAQTAPAFNQVGQVLQAMTQNAHEVARQFGYEGTLTVGALEDEIRFYQKRTADDLLELGKRLLLLKELTAHGEFKQRLELLGIADRMARKMMSATLKFSKRPLTAVLEAAGNPTKILELLVLDDDDIATLESGETVAGLHLDAIEAMSASELRHALRKAKTEAANARAAHDQVILQKNAHADELSEKLALAENRPRAERWPDQVVAYHEELHRYGVDVEQMLKTVFNIVVSGDPVPDMPVACQESIAIATIDRVNRLTALVAEMQNTVFHQYSQFIDKPVYELGDPLSLKVTGDL